MQLLVQASEPKAPPIRGASRYTYRKRVCIWTVIAAILIIGLGLGLYFAYKDTTQVHKGAVVANGNECADIGRDILQMGGSAADAAIATLFCEGITCPQSMGLGGGFIATIYTRSTGIVDSLIAREMAPLAASQDMFVNKSSISGALAVAVPGELRGYWQLHQKYGKLPWRKLVEPAINLSRNGYTVTEYLYRSMKGREELIRKNPTLNEIFINPKTGKVWRKGEKITRPKLAETLELIAEQGEKAMYDGGILGKRLANDIKMFGGIIEERDFKEYQVRWNKPALSRLRGGYTLYSAPLPGSGEILTFIMNLVNESITRDKKIFWHRIVESFKHGYAARTNLGDINFVPGILEFVANLSNINYAREIRRLIFDNQTFNEYEYYGANFSNPDNRGTANIAVLAPNGDAVTVTSTINDIFGSKLRSPSTGIILNDEMDDFSTPGKTNGFGIPPSPANFIKARKMPLSSMCPSIILDQNGDVRLLVGSAGGSKITSSVALTIIRHLILNESLEVAVQSRRLHHQLAPMKIMFETNFDPEVIQSLRVKGHELQEIPTGAGFSALTAIAFIDGQAQPVFDIRRSGSASLL